MPTPDTSRSDDESRRLWRLSGIGTELAAHVVAGVLLGLLFDLWRGTSPWGLLVGTVAGMAVGMTTFIRRALRLNRRSAEEYRRAHPPTADRDDDDQDD